MIRTHEFNTRWWGQPVGIVDDASFFELSDHEKKEKLARYEWVEYRQRLDAVSSPATLGKAGFFQADTQLSFLLGLARIEETPSTESLEIRFGDQQPFEVTAAELAPFQHERFKYLPNCDAELTNRRYALWANDLLQTYPQTCLQVWFEKRLQGWFLSRPTRSNHLELTLAMLSRNATISGMLLYQKACVAYAGLGFKVGEASFSVTNTAVHNIYARLGARFSTPLGNWLWIADR